MEQYIGQWTLATLGAEWTAVDSTGRFSVTVTVLCHCWQILQPSTFHFRFLCAILPPHIPQGHPTIFIVVMLLYTISSPYICCLLPICWNVSILWNSQNLKAAVTFLYSRCGGDLSFLLKSSRVCWLLNMKRAMFYWSYFGRSWWFLFRVSFCVTYGWMYFWFWL